MSEGSLTVKIAVCGDSGAGKTSLILRFWNDSFIEEHISTQTPDMCEREITHNGRKYKLQIYDTVGQEMHSAVTPKIYRDSDVVFVCFNPAPATAAEDSQKWVDEHIVEWVKMLENYRQPENKLVLVATKADLWDKESDPPIDFLEDEQGDELRKRCDAIALFKTSAMNNRGVDDLFNFAAEKTWEGKKEQPGPKPPEPRPHGDDGRKKFGCCN